MRTTLVATLVALAAAVTFAPGSPAQSGEAPAGFKFCNAPGYEDLVLVFLNPDLVARDDGLIHASGQFFIQFQARGETALEIETLKFSFGKPVPGAQICDPQAPYFGMPITEAVYLKNYRADNDYRDGFFVPINTYNVGDGVYAAAISVYNKEGVEMARGWANAIVENGGRRTGNDNCEGVPVIPPPATFYCPDFTKPWPMILPGDGERLDGKSGLYIEVAEDVSDIKVFINGKLAQLANATSPMRDDDVIPDLQYGPLVGNPIAEGQAKMKVWGPSWNWDGQINKEDVVKVIITDLWGNVAEKVVHIGDPTIGGRVTGGNPEFDILLDESSKTTDDRGRAVFNVTYVVKKDFLHGNVYVVNPKDPTGAMPSGITVKATPNHVMDGAGAEIKGTIVFHAGPTAAATNHDFALEVRYLYQNQGVAKSVPLKLSVSGKSNGTGDDDFASKFGTTPENIRGAATNNSANTNNAKPEEDKGFLGLPAPGVLPALAALGLAAVVALRRRR